MNNLNQYIYIVDDDADVRDGLTELLASVGLKAFAYSDAAEFLDAFSSNNGGCVLIDVRMPGMSGIELQQKLKEIDVTIPIIIITGHGDIAMAVQAMKDGAFEFLQKPFRDQDLLDTIAKALEKSKSNREDYKIKEDLLRRVNSLTARERQVIDKVLEGKANKVIARELDISDRTIEIHRAHAMQKLGATSLAEMVKIMLKVEND